MNPKGIPDKFCTKAHYYRFKNLKERYKITPKAVAGMFLKQRGRCKICNNIGHVPELGNPELEMLHIDHCHTSGKVRGLLCNTCNLGLGHFADNRLSILKAVWYLTTLKLHCRIYNNIIRVSQFTWVISI